MSAKHSDQLQNHVPYTWSYANEAARLAATGFVAADVGKLCRQLNTNVLYMLTATTPTWEQINGVIEGTGGLTPTGAGLYLLADLAIVTQTDTIINWTAKAWDTDTMHDSGTDGSRLTCATAGIYMVTAGLRYGASTTGYRRCTLLKNGALLTESNVSALTWSMEHTTAISIIIEAEVNDYYQIRTRQNAGTNQNILAANSYFSMQRIA